jgi:hypothetical protein
LYALTNQVVPTGLTSGKVKEGSNQVRVESGTGPLPSRAHRTGSSGGLQHGHSIRGLRSAQGGMGPTIYTNVYPGSGPPGNVKGGGGGKTKPTPKPGKSPTPTPTGQGSQGQGPLDPKTGKAGQPAGQGTGVTGKGKKPKPTPKPGKSPTPTPGKKPTPRPGPLETPRDPNA